MIVLVHVQTLKGIPSRNTILAFSMLV